MSASTENNVSLLSPFAASTATREFMQHVIKNEPDFLVKLSELARRLGDSQEAREAAIGAVIEFACDMHDSPKGDSADNDRRSELCAKALQQFLIRYHGLADSSPYGRFVLERLTQRLKDIKKQCTLQSYRYSLQVLRFCIIVCVTIPGLDPAILSECISALKHFLKTAEESITSPGAEDLLIQCFDLLKQHAFLLSQSNGGDLFEHVRSSLTNHRYPPGQLTDVALQSLETRAIRQYMDKLQNSSDMNMMSFWEMSNGVGAEEMMDDEMQEDYERFLAESAVSNLQLS